MPSPRALRDQAAIRRCSCCSAGGEVLQANVARKASTAVVVTLVLDELAARLLWISAVQVGQAFHADVCVGLTVQNRSAIPVDRTLHTASAGRVAHAPAHRRPAIVSRRALDTRPSRGIAGGQRCRAGRSVDAFDAHTAVGITRRGRGRAIRPIPTRNTQPVLGMTEGAARAQRARVRLAGSGITGRRTLAAPGMTQPQARGKDAAVGLNTGATRRRLAGGLRGYKRRSTLRRRIVGIARRDDNGRDAACPARIRRRRRLEQVHVLGLTGAADEHAREQRSRQNGRVQSQGCSARISRASSSA